jgi:transposase
MVCENRCVPTKKPRASAELRAKALEMKANGYTVEAIARALGVAKNSIYNWQQWQREGRAAGLADKTPERPSALGDTDRTALARLIETTTPEDHGFDSRLWTRDIVAALIKQQFGIAFTPKWAGQILRDLGFTPQRPKYRSDRRGTAAVEKWRTETFPAIAAEAADAGAEIFFGDESAEPVPSRFAIDEWRCDPAV